jgi:hypothetical protein
LPACPSTASSRMSGWPFSIIARSSIWSVLPCDDERVLFERSRQTSAGQVLRQIAGELRNPRRHVWLPCLMSETRTDAAAPGAKQQTSAGVLQVSSTMAGAIL